MNVNDIFKILTNNLIKWISNKYFKYLIMEGIYIIINFVIVTNL